MSRQEDLEFVDLLESMSPEELSSLTEEEMDALLAAKMRVSADENPDDPHLASIASTLGDAYTSAGGDEQPPEFAEPEFGEPEFDSESYGDGFDISEGEPTGIGDDESTDYTSDDTDDSGDVSNPAVADSVGDASSVDYDSMDDYEDEYTNDDYLGGDEPENENADTFTPQRPQHPGDEFDENSIKDDTDSSDVEGSDPFSDKVDLEDEKPGLIDRIKELPTPVKFGVPAVLVVLILAMTVLSGGEESGSDPVGNGSGQGNGGGAAAPADGHAPVAGEEQDGDPILLTDYIDTTSAKCVDNPKSKDKGPTKAFSSVDTDAWVCYRAMGIDGSVMNIVFREPVTLTEIRLTPGFNFLQEQSGEDKWVQHRVVTRILWRAGGKQFVQEIDPQRNEVSYIFDEPVTTDSMSLTIQQSVVPEGASEGAGGGDADIFAGEDKPESSAGKLQDATAIQNLQIYGYPGKKSGGDNAKPKSPSGSGGSGAGVDVAPEAGAGQ